MRRPCLEKFVTKANPEKNLKFMRKRKTVVTHSTKKRRNVFSVILTQLLLPLLEFIVYN